MGKKYMCEKCYSSNVKRSEVPTGIGVLWFPKCQDCDSIRVTSDIIKMRKIKMRKIKKKQKKQKRRDWFLSLFNNRV